MPSFPSNLRRVTVGVCAAVSAATAVGAAHGRDPQSVLDTRGTPVPIASLPQMLLAHSDYQRAYLLATTHGRSYYRLLRPGRVCFGVGSAGQPRTLGLIQCYYPRELPLLIDFSVWESTHNNPRLHAWRLEGLAPDRVARLAILTAGGTPIANLPVVRGIYYDASLPKKAVRWFVVTRTPSRSTLQAAVFCSRCPSSQVRRTSAGVR